MQLERATVAELSPPEGTKTRSASSMRGLADLDALRVVLTGRSVIDSPRLWFPDREAVDDFLRLHAFDTDNPLDLEALDRLRHDAASYLAEHHGYQVPDGYHALPDCHALFLEASLGEGNKEAREGVKK